MHITVSDTWIGKYSDFPSQNTLNETKICNLHHKARRRAFPVMFMWEAPPPLPREIFLQLEMMANTNQIIKIINLIVAGHFAK